MKNILSIALLILAITSTGYGQKNIYGINIGIGGGMIMKEALEGDASYDLNTGVTLGLQYSRNISERLYFTTGLNWYKNCVSVTPNFHPDVDMTEVKHDVQLLYIPAFLTVTLSKHFSLQGGLMADIDITSDKYITKQSGMGAGFAIAGEAPFNETFALQVSPYLNFHGLLLSDSDQYPERIFDSGIKLNFVFRK